MWVFLSTVKTWFDKRIFIKHIILRPRCFQTNCSFHMVVTFWPFLFNYTYFMGFCRYYLTDQHLKHSSKLFILYVVMGILGVSFVCTHLFKIRYVSYHHPLTLAWIYLRKRFLLFRKLGTFFHFTKKMYDLKLVYFDGWT